MTKVDVETTVDMFEEYAKAIIRDESSPSVEDALRKIEIRKALVEWLMHVLGIKDDN